MANELYSTLGLQPSASADEVKRAYFRQVREHPPEKDPEHFKLIRSAYETLSDGDARANYDRLQRFGGEVQRLADDAEEHMRGEEWLSAVRLYKEVIVLAPDLEAAWSSLAMCQAQLGDYDHAQKSMERLTSLAPEVAAYWTHFGYLYLGWADDFEEDSSAGRQALEHAMDCFERAIELDGNTADAYVGVAMCYRDLGDLQQAATWLEGAVTADDSLDIEDYDALQHLCMIYALQERRLDLHKTADRIGHVAPEDPDQRKYMAARMCVLAAQLGDVGFFAEAEVLFEGASKLDPSNSDINEAAEAFATLGGALDEWKRLEHDERVIPPIRALGPYFLQRNMDEDFDSDGRIWRGFTEALGTYPPQQIISSIQRLSDSYPSTYKMNYEFLRGLWRVAKDVKQQQAAYASSAGSGCALALVLGVLSLAAVAGGVAVA